MNNRVLEFSRLLVLASCMALILIYTANEFIIASSSNVTFWLIKVIPIAAILPSLIKRNLRSYQWLCFLIMIYFIQGILDIFSSDRIIQGILETFFTTLLFCCAIFFVHRCQKLNQQQTPIQE